MKTFAILLLLSFIIPGQILFGQSNSKQSLTYDFGSGATSGGGVSAVGAHIALGYSMFFNESRYFFNPNLLIGAYRSDGFVYQRPNYYNNLSFRAQFGVDIIRYKHISMDIQTGAIIGTARGMLGTGGEFEAAISERIKEWKYGVIASSSIKYNIPNTRLTIRIVPMSAHIGPEYYLELHSSLGFEIRL